MAIHNRPRDIIFNELNRIYLSETCGSGPSWYSPGSFGTDLNKAVTVLILDHLASLYIMHPDDPGYTDSQESLLQEITNIIWASWPGGGTAENAAKNILRSLGIQVKENAR